MVMLAGPFEDCSDFRISTPNFVGARYFDLFAINPDAYISMPVLVPEL